MSVSVAVDVGATDAVPVGAGVGSEVGAAVGSAVGAAVGSDVATGRAVSPVAVEVGSVGTIGTALFSAPQPASANEAPTTTASPAARRAQNGHDEPLRMCLRHRAQGWPPRARQHAPDS